MEVLNFIMEIGEQMLTSGAEVHRVEESIKRMCLAFGAKRVDVFIITSSMVVTVHTVDSSTFTQTRRIIAINTDFEKLHKLNKLSRDICEKHLNEEEIKERLYEIVNAKRYPIILELLFYAITTGIFTVFFGGNFKAAIISFMVGFFVRFGIFLCEKIISNKIFLKFLSMVIVTILAILTTKTGLVLKADTIIIGNVMTLIPGIGLTNALRDLFVGDSIAGILRLIEALLTAIAIAAGYFCVVMLIGGIV